MTRHSRPLIGLLCQLWATSVRRHTSFYAAPCHNAGAVNQEPRSAADDWRKRLKRALRFFSILVWSFLEDIISTWAAEAVNFSQTPTPPPPRPPPPQLCLEANPLISCVSMDLQRTILYVYEKEGRRRKPIHFFSVPCLYNHFEMAAVLLCFVSWEVIWILSQREWEKKKILLFGLLPCVWSETRDNHASPALLWINGFFCYYSVRKHRSFLTAVHINIS